MTTAAAQWLVEMTWQVALLGAIVWTLDQLLPRRVGPSPRIALWSLVLLKLLLPPTLSSPVSIAQLWTPFSNAPLPQAQSGQAHSRHEPPSKARPWNGGAMPPAAIVSIWLAGTLLTGGAMIWRYRRARRLWLDAVVGDDDEDDEAGADDAGLWVSHRLHGKIGGDRVRTRQQSSSSAAERGVGRAMRRLDLDLDRDRGSRQAMRAARALRAAARRVGLRGPLPPIRVRAAHHPDAFESAAIVGFFRPTIVLPASLLTPARDAQRAPMLEHVLLHEAAHLARRDPQMHLACLLLQAIYWFHPIAWIARRRLETLREMACDRRVARALEGDVAAYRRTLLWLARPLVEGPAPTGLAFLARRSQLLMRLDALAHAGCGRVSRQARALSALGCGVVLASCVPLHRSAPHTPVSGPEAPDVAIATPGATSTAAPIAANAPTTPSQSADSPTADSPAPAASAPAPAPSSPTGAAATPPTAASSATPTPTPATATPSPVAPSAAAAPASVAVAADAAPPSVVRASATPAAAGQAAAAPAAAAPAAAMPKAASGREAADAIDLRTLRGSLQVRYTVLRALAARDGAPPD